MNAIDRTRRQELRARTARAHADLDTLVGEFATVADYRRYVRGMAAFRSSIEPRIRSLPAALAGWNPCLIGRALELDLADLGMAWPASMPGDDSRLSDGDLFGVLYVLEGSSLGARLLRKRASVLGFDDTYGARHLSLQCQSPDAWKAFLSQLETAEPFDLDEAATAADATFRLAARAFESIADVESR